MSRRLIALLALALALPLAGCVPALIGAGGAAVYSALEDRRTTGTQVHDEAIAVRRGNRISDRFGSRVHANVTSYNRVVLVTGEVPDDAARAEVEKIVRAVPNV